MVRRGRKRFTSLAGIEQLEARQLLAADLIISEFMAINDSGLADQDGDLEDWIEIHNSSQQSVSLQGWHLTDDSDNLTRWQFPNLTLAAGDYQLVRASGKDLTDPSAELHTNFKLSGSGEFLALVQPDGVSIEDSFSPEYPAQVGDVSYGVAADQSQIGFFTVPSPGAANLQAPIDDPLRTLVVNEIMYHPSSERVEDEFIEVLNRGEESLNLSGWRISGGIDFDFPNITLPPGELLVVAGMSHRLKPFTGTKSVWSGLGPAA